MNQITEFRNTHTARGLRIAYQMDGDPIDLAILEPTIREELGDDSDDASFLEALQDMLNDGDLVAVDGDNTVHAVFG